MKLPGRLTVKHIKAHKDMGNKFFIYKHQKIDVEKTWNEIEKDKKSGTKDGDRYNGISSKVEKNTKLRRSDIDSSNSSGSKPGERSRKGES
jgi:hypothetical protein